jgi:hypothetical protein
MGARQYVCRCTPSVRCETDAVGRGDGPALVRAMPEIELI